MSGQKSPRALEIRAALEQLAKDRIAEKLAKAIEHIDNKETFSKVDVAGAFINVGGTSAIDNTTGVLFSAGNFTAGSKVVASGDTINVTYTLSAAG